MNLNKKKNRFDVSGRDLLSVIARGFQTGHLRRAAVSVVLGASTLSMMPAQATETNAKQMGDNVNAAKTKAKKAGRKTKKDVRDATGNHSPSQDLKDKGNNVKDSASDTVKKATP